MGTVTVTRSTRRCSSHRGLRERLVRRATKAPHNGSSVA